MSSDEVGGSVAGVLLGSPAQRAGIRAGDRILTANSRILTDVIAWWWESEGSAVEVTVVRESSTGALLAPRRVMLERSHDEPWGIDFADLLFDGVRTCRNSCAFCFMAQLPRGLRPALYLRDDDYRLSFLNGNFITLTNLEDSDVARISDERLSPLYVSLHAVSPAVRARLLCAREDRALERFDELVEAGIDLHIQIVLIPGENDAHELQRTLRWLASREGVHSVGVVPVGYTAHQHSLKRSYETPVEAAAILDAIAPWEIAARERDGVGWVYAADEFYLTAGRLLPSAEAYDGYPQYENGIGLVRAFAEEFGCMLSALPTSLSAPDASSPISGSPPATVVTGTLFEPVIRDLLAQHELTRGVEVLGVPNRFFGGNVSVAGLLTGADIAASVRSRAPIGPVVLPDVVLNDDGLTLDDMTVPEISAAAGTRVTVVRSDPAGLLSGIL